MRISSTKISQLAAQMQALSEGGDSPEWQAFHAQMSAIPVQVTFHLGVAAIPAVSGFSWVFLKGVLQDIQNGTKQFRPRDMDGMAVQGMIVGLPPVAMPLVTALLIAMELAQYEMIVECEKGAVPASWGKREATEESEEEFEEEAP